MNKLKDFLRITDAAKYLGVSPNTLRNWERSGKIVAHRHPVNGYRLFKQEELDVLLNLAELPSTNAEVATRKPR
ncbi:MAG: helix-turn-helix domain-containing protein [Pirellulaceae bacterium]|nr:helix-turn-helix domain-containing protein [Pirellulaceae bacterium]